jgi:hypothetical protein
MSFEDMCRDEVSLVKSDGRVINKIKANVQSNKIPILDDKLPLEENDHLYRSLPNGLVESYLVLDRGFITAIGSFKNHYQAKVIKETSINSEKFQQITNVYNLNGNNSRMNIHSIDKSLNVSTNSNQMF